MFRPVEKKSLATAVYEQLREHIVSGEASPGSPLPSERVLSELLKVNRGAVREGLRRLEQAGLVAVSQGGATQVLDYKKSGGLEVLGALVVRDGKIDTRVARSILDLRSTLGQELARTCAKKRAAGRLDEIVEAMKAKKGDLPALQGLALQFWEEVVRGADGIAWQLAFNSMRASYGLIQEHLLHVLSEELQATREYAALARAVGRGEEEAAAKHAAAIVGLGAQAIEKVLGALDRKEVRR